MKGRGFITGSLWGSDISVVHVSHALEPVARARRVGCTTGINIGHDAGQARSAMGGSGCTKSGGGGCDGGGGGGRSWALCILILFLAAAALAMAAKRRARGSSRCRPCPPQSSPIHGGGISASRSVTSSASATASSWTFFTLSTSALASVVSINRSSAAQARHLFLHLPTRSSDGKGGVGGRRVSVCARKGGFSYSSSVRNVWYRAAPPSVRT